LPGIDFETIRIELDAGDTLVMYTDGATEARTPAGTLFGEAGWLRLVSDAPADPGDLVASVTGRAQSRGPGTTR